MFYYGKSNRDRYRDSFIYRNLEEELKTILGTKVSINAKDNRKGKLEIEYYSQEELDSIIDLLRTVER